MKTKAQIVQQLLEDKKINAEEAVILLIGEKEYIYLNQPVWPINPYPYLPNWQSPFVNVCNNVAAANHLN